jgi:NAD(P)H-flavin reductase
LSGKHFCDCINWKGVCIYQEYIWNGNKAKPERSNYLYNILKKEILEEKIAILTIETTHKMAKDLLHPGSYIFVRNPECMQYYDAPISIMESNTEENWVKIAIELKGTKTTSIFSLQEGEKILVRGPYWNGILGLKNIYAAKNGNSLLIIRGIGQAPAVPVMKKLYSNGNQLSVLIDNRPFEQLLIGKELLKYNCCLQECKTIDRGELTPEFKEILAKKIEEIKPNIIHIAGPDLLSYKVISLLKDYKSYSCCNNAKMCCGEGICGSCTVKTNDHKLRRLCKLQTEPKFILRGRRKL